MSHTMHVSDRRAACGQVRPRRILGAAGLLGAWLGLPGLAAGAPAPRAGYGKGGARARCQVVIILGQEARAPLPRALHRFGRDLRRGPFKRFGSFALLGTRQLWMDTARRSRRSLVGPYRLESRLLGRVDRPGAPGQLRFELFLFRRRPGRGDRQLLRTRLLASTGTTVLLAGPRYRKGRLILALTCR